MINFFIMRDIKFQLFFWYQRPFLCYMFLAFLKALWRRWVAEWLAVIFLLFSVSISRFALSPSLIFPFLEPLCSYNLFWMAECHELQRKVLSLYYSCISYLPSCFCIKRVWSNIKDKLIVWDASFMLSPSKTI